MQRNWGLAVVEVEMLGEVEKVEDFEKLGEVEKAEQHYFIEFGDDLD
jgi:hypothetical protein